MRNEAITSRCKFKNVCGKWKVKSRIYTPLSTFYSHVDFTCFFDPRLPPANSKGFGDHAASWVVPHPASDCAQGYRGRQIEYIAQVKGHELTTRGELLKDEVNHPRSKEEYYKIQLGALKKLPAPISAEKWKRLTFLHPTGEYLQNARLLNNLVVHTEEREILWKGLCERAEHEQLDKTDLPKADIPAEVLIALLGMKEMQGPYDVKEKSNGNID